MHWGQCWFPQVPHDVCSVRGTSTSIGNISKYSFIFPTPTAARIPAIMTCGGVKLLRVALLVLTVQSNAQVAPLQRVVVRESQSSNPNLWPGDRKWLWSETKESCPAQHVHLAPFFCISFSFSLHSNFSAGNGSCVCAQQGQLALFLTTLVQRASDPRTRHLLNSKAPFTIPIVLYTFHHDMLQVRWKHAQGDCLCFYLPSMNTVSRASKIWLPQIKKQVIHENIGSDDQCLMWGRGSADRCPRVFFPSQASVGCGCHRLWSQPEWGLMGARWVR